jgi:hypothetical protein
VTADKFFDGTDNPVQKAHEVVAATRSIKTLWHDLCQFYHFKVRNGHMLKEFPYWILDEVPHELIPQMLELEYGVKGAKAIVFYGPRLEEHYKVPLWQFVLFFGSLTQPKVAALNKIPKNRRGLNFDSLYRELKHIRSKRVPFSDGPLMFGKADFKKCCLSVSRQQTS